MKALKDKDLTNQLMSTDGYGYNVKYEHTVTLDGDGVPYLLIDWCANNSKGKWGWFFDKSATPHVKAIMSFEREKDALWFALCKG